MVASSLGPARGAGASPLASAPQFFPAGDVEVVWRYVTVLYEVGRSIGGSEDMLLPAKDLITVRD